MERGSPEAGLRTFVGYFAKAHASLSINRARPAGDRLVLVTR